MKKYLSLLTILALGGAVSPLINSTISNTNSTKLLKNLENLKNTSSVKSLISNGNITEKLWKDIENLKELANKKNNISTNSQVNFLAGQVMAQVMSSTPINASSLTALLPAGLCTGLIFGVLLSVIDLAVSIARAIPLLGPLVVEVILGLSISNIVITNPDQKLTEGNNNVGMNFNFGGQISSTVAHLTNVQPESKDANQVSGSILAGVLASTPLDGAGAGLTAGLPVVVVFSVVAAILTTVIGLAVAIAGVLPLIGGLVVEILLGLSISNIVPVNLDQKLTEGNNQIPTDLNIGGHDTKTDLNIGGVAKESTNPTQIAGSIISGVVASTPINGAGLTEGLPVAVVMGLVPGVLTGIIASVLAIVEGLIGPLFPQVIVIVKGLNVTNIVPSGSSDQKLSAGTNQVPVDLNMGGEITKGTLNINNVGKESSNPTQVAGSILAGVLASTPIDCSSLIAGVSVVAILGTVVAAVLAVVIAAALAVLALLGPLPIVAQVTLIIKGLNVSNITAIDTDQKLSAGTNQVPVGLNLGGQVNKTGLTLTGVKAA